MESKKSKRTLRKYDSEFKTQVPLMVENGQPIAQVARSLGIGENLIYAWRKQAGGQGKEKKAFRVKKDSPEGAQPLLEEIERLRVALRQKEVALERSEQEKEILKKALSIFSQPTR